MVGGTNSKYNANITNRRYTDTWIGNGTKAESNNFTVELFHEKRNSDTCTTPLTTTHTWNFPINMNLSALY